MDQSTYARWLNNNAKEPVPGASDMFFVETVTVHQTAMLSSGEEHQLICNLANREERV